LNVTDIFEEALTMMFRPESYRLFQNTVTFYQTTSITPENRAIFIVTQ
jgi:hypothetical protein